MKTKPANKKGKKQSLNEPFFLSKLDQKSENIVKSKKNHKKVKIDNTIQNGDSSPKSKVQQLQKINKQKKKQMKLDQNDDNIEKLTLLYKKQKNMVGKIKPIALESKKKIPNKAKEKKLKHLKNTQLIHTMNKNVPKKTYRHAPGTVDVEILKSKVAEIKNRETLSKTARKKISALLRKISVFETERTKQSGTIGKDNEKNKQQINVSVENKQKANIKYKRKAKKEHGKNKKAKIDREENNENAKDDNDEEQSDIEEKEEEEIDIAQEKVDIGNVEGKEDNREEEDSEEMAIVKVTKKKQKVTKQSSDVSKKEMKKQYFLYVGNLSHDITSNELKKHFLSKVNAVTSINIQTKPGTKKSHNFAYVELSNNADYKKALSLHHTFLKKKRINVQYAASKDANKVDIVAKNKKLGTPRKTGKLVDVKKKKKLSKKGKQKSMGSKA